MVWTVIKWILLQHSFIGGFIIPGLPSTSYQKPGDLLLGGIFRVHEYHPDTPCGSETRAPKSFQYHEAMVHAINIVNADQQLLPNISLGFVILDDCTKDQTALARAMSFMPSSSTCNCSESPNYDVVGVISGSNSQNTMSAAGLLSMVHVPVIGAVSTSDLLSNKNKYKFFLRVVPPDPYQAQAMIDLVTLHKWTYVSVIYSDGGYGEMGAKAVHELAKQRGICIAFSHKIDRSKGNTEYSMVISNLYEMRNARVVILFVQGSDGRGIIAAAKEMGIMQHFIWIASDAVSPSNDLVGLEDNAVGSLFVQLYSTGIPTFTQYFESLHPTKSDNPWLLDLWEREFGCRTNCSSNHTISTMPAYRQYNKTGLFMDTVKTYATGLHQLINNTCPEAFWSKALLKDCVNGAQLFPYLQNVSFEGSYGTVQFDKNGNADGKYQIDQLQFDGRGYLSSPIGIWDKMTGTLQDLQPRQWTHMSDFTGDIEWIPESICSKKCLPGEFYIQLELKCCWECRPCRENEIVVSNFSNCSQCPPFFWPDQLTFLECDPIPPSFISFDDTVAVFCLAFIILGLLVCIWILVVFVRHRKDKLIKATSMQLSTLSLIGIVMGYFTAILILIKPSDSLCLLCRLGFNLGFAITYAPLLAKTSRIYRIFASGKRGSKKITFISARSQLVLSSVLITIQVTPLHISKCFTYLNNTILNTFTPLGGYAFHSACCVFSLYQIEI